MIDRYVERVLDHTGGNLTQAASILGISRRTLHRMAARKRGEDVGEGDNLSQSETT
jgi:DNA-binding NtrC family response regulator